MVKKARVLHDVLSSGIVVCKLDDGIPDNEIEWEL